MSPGARVIGCLRFEWAQTMLRVDRNAVAATGLPCTWHDWCHGVRAVPQDTKSAADEVTMVPPVSSSSTTSRPSSSDRPYRPRALAGPGEADGDRLEQRLVELGTLHLRKTPHHPLDDGVQGFVADVGEVPVDRSLRAADVVVEVAVVVEGQRVEDRVHRVRPESRDLDLGGRQGLLGECGESLQALGAEVFELLEDLLC